MEYSPSSLPKPHNRWGNSSTGHGSSRLLAFPTRVVVNTRACHYPFCISRTLRVLGLTNCLEVASAVAFIAMTAGHWWAIHSVWWVVYTGKGEAFVDLQTFILNLARLNITLRFLMKYAWNLSFTVF